MAEHPSTSSSPTPKNEKPSIEGCGKHGNEAAEKRLMARIEAECEEHSHTAEDQHETNSRKVLFMIILTFIFFVIELTVGFVNRSIALLADSYHMLSDVMALCVALICLRISKRKSKNNGFGWVRAEVLGALVNGTFLLTMCFMISVESVGRIIHPNKMSHPLQVLIVGVIGLLINVVGIGLFHGGHGHSHGGGGGGGHGHSHDHKKDTDHKHSDSEHKHKENEEELELVDDHDHPKKTTRSLSHISNEVSHNLSMMITSGSKQHLALKMVNLNDAIPQEEYSDEDAAAAFRKKMKENENLNMRGVFLHIVSDAIGSVFVVITAAVALWAPTSFEKVTIYMDPCLSMILVSLISFSAYRLVKETSAILLGKPPAFVNFDLLKRDIKKIQGVALVEEVRVWTLVSNRHLAAAKVEFCSAAAFDQAAPKIRALFHNAAIHSLTLQPLFTSPCCKSPTIDPIAETPESEDSANNNDNVQEGMSTDFSLLTAELTIDLEETENEDLPTPIQEYVDAKKLAFASRYQPLKEKDLHFNISDRILIHDLTVDALERLENHLNLEEVGTMLNWQSVAAKLGLNMDSIEGLFNVYGYTRGVMVKCSNMPLNKLIKALVEVRRIDTLYTLYGLYMEEKLFKVLEKPSLPLDYSAASTAIVSSKHVPRLMESGSILVVSYCSGKREERNVDHLLQHLVHPKYNTTNKPVYLVGDVVSDENIEQSAVEALRKAEHVVFCFTPSLLDLINNAETSPLDFKSRSVASISRMANEEYWAQKNRNTRFRAVTFDKFPLDLKTVGWAKATIEYKFPTQAQMFFKRIFENVLIS